MLKKLQAKISVQKINNKITVIASDETLDRHGEVLPIENWDLQRFLDAPRMLVDHDHRVEKIVGRWENARVENGKLLMEPNFHQFTDLAKAVDEMVNADPSFLDTVSVGFIVNPPKKDGDRETFELIETSWVTVPANHNARIMKALEAVPTEEQLTQIKDFAGEKEVEGAFIKSVEEFNTEKESGKTQMLCEAQFIQNLVDDSEKHKILIEDHKKLKKVVASNNERNAEAMKLALKEVARTVCDALRKNKAHSLKKSV